MKRLLIMTIGKTHSGKSTFARLLAKRLPNTAVIDQDNQAAFLHTHYPALLPKEGPNRIKQALTWTLVEHAVEATNCHLVLCNSNLEAGSRRDLLAYFKSKGFACFLVHFRLPDQLLRERIKTSRRSRSVLRTAASFAEVLERQQRAAAPDEEEADKIYNIQSEADVEEVICRILGTSDGT